MNTLGTKRLGLPNVTLVFSNDMNGMVLLKEAYIKMRYEYQEQVPVQQKEVTIKPDKESENATNESTEKTPEKMNESASNKATDKTNEGETSDKTPEGTDKTPEEMDKKTPDKTSEDIDKASEGADKTSEEKNTTKVEPPVQMATVTKRKIRKVSLRVTPISDRLIIKPLTEEQKTQSITL